MNLKPFAKWSVSVCMAAGCLGAPAERVERIMLDADTDITVAAGETLDVAVVDGDVDTEYSIEKHGAGTLRLRRIRARRARVAVHAGGLEFAPAAFDAELAAAAAAKAWFHVDATKRDSLRFADGGSGGRQRIELWTDSRGDGYPSARAYERKPYLAENGQNGLPVVDFGGLYREEDGVTQKGDAGTMLWNRACDNIREVFLVVADSDDVLAEMNNENVTGAAMFYLGHRDRNTYHFHRGAAGAMFRNLSHANIRDGYVGLDGVQVSHLEQMYGGFHLVHLRTAGNVSAEAFARDRSNMYGGLKYGEVLIFTELLPEEESEALVCSLMEKWGLPQRLHAFRVEDGTTVAVPAGRSLYSKSMGVAGDVTFTGGGSIAMRKIAEVTGARGNLSLGGVTFHVEDRPADTNRGSGGASGLTSFTPAPSAPFPVYGTFRVDTLASGGTLTKTGTGLLRAARLDADNVDVREGTLELDALATHGPAYHIDASQRAFVVTEDPGGTGTNWVTNLKDVSGGEMEIYGNHSSPWLRENFLNGKPVVDFAGFRRSDNASVNGKGGDLLWKKRLTNIREVYLVFSYTEDGQAWMDQMNGPILLGDTQATPNHFHSGKGQMFHDSSSSALVRNGLIQVDGATVNHKHRLTEGFHLIHLRPTGNVTAGAFACLGGNYRGGSRLAEALIFTNMVDGAADARIQDALGAKWFNRPAGTAYPFRRVAAEAGAVFRVPYAQVSAGTLTGAGTVQAAKVTAANVTGADGLTVDGALTLPDGGAVEMSGAPETGFAGVTVTGALTVEGAGEVRLALDGEAGRFAQAAGNPFALVRAASCAGDLSRWKVKTGPCFARLEFSDGALRARFHPTSTVIVFR